MPPKRKAQPRANGRDQWNFISGSEASQYKAQLDAGEELDTGSLLKLLHADQACEALYSKSCKVKEIDLSVKSALGTRPSRSLVVACTCVDICTSILTD